MEAATKRVGRPTKLRECMTCHEMKGARDFPSKDASDCRACRRLLLSPIPGVSGYFQTPTRRSEMAQNAIAESLQFVTSLQLAIKLAQTLPRCVCCYEAQHVREVHGVRACAVCAVQIEAAGRCETHRSAQIVPELTSCVVPHVPREVHALFEPQVSYPPRVAPEIEPDDDP